MKKFFYLNLLLLPIFFLGNVEAFQFNDFFKSPVRGGITTIDVHGNCKKIKNTSSTKYFIPTRTESEWDKFLAHKPSGVSESECCTWTKDWVFNGGPYDYTTDGTAGNRGTKVCGKKDWVSRNNAHNVCDGDWGRNVCNKKHDEWVYKSTSDYSYGDWGNNVCADGSSNPQYNGGREYDIIPGGDYDEKSKTWNTCYSNTSYSVKRYRLESVNHSKYNGGWEIYSDTHKLWNTCYSDECYTVIDYDYTNNSPYYNGGREYNIIPGGAYDSNSKTWNKCYSDTSFKVYRYRYKDVCR